LDSSVLALKLKDMEETTIMKFSYLCWSVWSCFIQ